MAGLAEAGEDEAVAVGERELEAPGGGEPVETWEVDVEHRDVGALAQRGRLDLVAAIELGDDLHVGLEADQCDEGAADEMHVFGDEHADHVATSTRRVKESPSPAVRRRPPTARRRSAMPVSPVPEWPAGGRGRSLVASIQTAASPRPASSVQCRASLWRSTFVAASRTTQPSAASTAPGSGPGSPERRTSMPASRRSRSPASLLRVRRRPARGDDV